MKEKIKKRLEKAGYILFRRYGAGICEYIEKIHPRENAERYFFRRFPRYGLLMALLLIFAGIGVVVSRIPQNEPSQIIDGKYVKRGEEEETVRLIVSEEGEEESWQHTFSLRIEERKLSKEEMENLEKKTGDYIRETLPGKNTSLEHVEKKLCMNKTVPDTDIALEWIYDERYIRKNGSLIQGSLAEEGVRTEVMVRAEWKNWKKSYSFEIVLFPGKVNRQKEKKKMVEKQIKEVVKEQADCEKIRLPTEINGKKVSYKTGEETRDYTFLYVSLGALFLVPMCIYRNRKKKLEKRETQMLLDHPALVNRMMLLLGAGLTVRRSFERMAKEYEEKRENGGEIRYVYEELCVMVQRIRDGVSEKQAIESFGRRCRLLPYLRFSSIVTQNLKKGADGILEILEKESLEALEQRKQRVLQYGETAGTKLLFPMMIMLGLVMGIIMVPAFMTM